LSGPVEDERSVGRGEKKRRRYFGGPAYLVSTKKGYVKREFVGKEGWGRGKGR